MDQPMELWKEFLADLEAISKDNRQKIGDACARYLTKTGRTELDQEATRGLFLATLDGMADLIQYGELGPTAITRLHDARRQCGICLPEADERRKRATT